MKNILPFFFLIIFISAFSGMVNSQTDTLVLQPGPIDGIDVTIQDINPTSTYNTDADFHANAWTAQGISFIDRGLIEFNLTSIPLNATVISATLTLHTNLNSINYQLNYGDNAAWLIRVLAPWQVDQVTWNTQPEIATSNFINLPQITVNDTIGYNVNVKTDVQNMVTNPGVNFGWIIKLQTEAIYTARNFASSDNAVPEWRPKLTVIYSHCTPPQADFSFVVNQYTVNFTDQSQPTFSWNWQFGDGGTSILQNPEHIYPASGEYIVRLTIQDICGVTTHIDTVHIVCTPPVAGFYFQVSYHDVKFYDTSQSTTAYGWFWDFGDGGTSTLQNPGHLYTFPGDYPVQLTVQDSCGLATHPDTVHIHCTTPVAGFYSQVSYPYVEFYDTTQSTTAFAWFWDFGDGMTSTDQNPIHEYVNSSPYTVCLKVTDSCSIDSICNEVSFFLPIHVQFSSVQIVPNGLEVAFTDKTEGATEWLWSFGDGATSILQNPVHAYKQGGGYSVCLKAGNGSSYATSCDSIHLPKATSVERYTTAVYPNPPITNEITISFEMDANYADISLYNFLGKLIEHQQITPINKTIPITLILPEIQPGVYFLKVRFNETEKVFKVLIP